MNTPTRKEYESDVKSQFIEKFGTGLDVIWVGDPVTDAYTRSDGANFTAAQKTWLEAWSKGVAYGMTRS